MVARKGQVQVTLWVEPEERDALQNLCKTHSKGVSGLLRAFIHSCIQNQSVEFSVGGGSNSVGQVSVRDAGVSYGQLQSVTKRLTEVEKKVPAFDLEDLKRMKTEILSGETDSMRYRLSELEWKLEKLVSGSVVWGVGEEEIKESRS